MLGVVLGTEAQPLEKMPQSSAAHRNLHFVTASLEILNMPNCRSFTLCE